MDRRLANGEKEGAQAMQFVIASAHLENCGRFFRPVAVSAKSAGVRRAPQRVGSSVFARARCDRKVVGVGFAHTRVGI
eukprot:4443079-Prymnesium_polylepis.1